MSPLIIAGAIFVLMNIGSTCGMALHPLLESHHLSNKYKELLQSNRSVMVQLLAVTLGLLIAQSLDAFERKASVLKNQAADVITLKHVLADFGPEGERAKSELHKSIDDEIFRIESAAKSGNDLGNKLGKFTMEALRGALIDLSPKTPSQQYLKTTALALGERIISARWQIYEQMTSNLQWPLISVFVFWLVSIFFSFGLLTPRDGLLMGGLLLSSFSLAAAIYLVIELDTPYQGFVSISSAPLRLALSR